MPAHRKHWKHRILYIGRDLNLLEFLSKLLEDCKVVRCPGGSNAHLLIESEINYSLLIFDEKVMDRTGAELERFTRQLPHRQQTPVIIYKKSDDYHLLVETITRELYRRSG